MKVIWLFVFVQDYTDLGDFDDFCFLILEDVRKDSGHWEEISYQWPLFAYYIS